MFPEKIKIMGEKWRIEIRKYEDDESLHEGELGGYCAVYIKTIVIRDFRLETDEETAVRYMREALRHEIIHAFFYESGLWNNSSGAENCSMDEQTIDWFAIQSPKIFRVYKECNIL